MPQGLRVLDEVFLQYAQQLDWLLMLLPNPLRLPHINWLQILVRRRSGCEVPPYPLDGALLVRDEEFWLPQHVRLHSLLFVLRHLARQEVHIISFWVTLPQPLEKLRGGKRDTDPSLNVECHHPVEQQVVLTLRNYLQFVSTGHCDRDMTQVHLNKLPCTLLTRRTDPKSVLELLTWLVSGNYQVLLHQSLP